MVTITDHDTSTQPAASRPLELALGLATLAFEHGASAVAADRAFTALARALGVDDAFAVWRLDCVTAARTNGSARAVVRPLVSRGINLLRVAAVAAIVEDLAPDSIAERQVEQEIARVASLGSPYSRWALIAATGFAAAVFSKNASGQWLGAGSALAGAVAGQALRQWLLQTKVSAPAITLGCATLSALIAAFGLQLRMGEAAPSVLIASVIYLIPGVALINGFLEAVMPQYLTVGVQRITGAIFTCILMAVGVAFAVAVMRQV